MKAKGCFKPRPIEYIITEKGCHLCTSHKSKRSGYPRIDRNGKDQNLVRYLWEEKYGKSPKNQQVCHKCDNPACININHIFFGTQKENIADMIQKNRNLKGEKNPGAKLTEDLVRFIRSKRFFPDEKAEFCKIHKISLSTFYNIEKGKKWKHVK
jgi:hypothetical protein